MSKNTPAQDSLQLATPDGGTTHVEKYEFEPIKGYPNYIFALTMGTGKTILMATCIFYEFLLGNKFEKDAHYCHNALVFAPDKTVLHSLKEIESFVRPSFALSSAATTSHKIAPRALWIVRKR